MGGTRTYSGISTKTRGMQHKLLHKADYVELESQKTVGDALTFLKRFPCYNEAFAGLTEENAHRAQIETLLNISWFNNYRKLYLFADLNQRKFMDTYFKHYEVAMIKRRLRTLYAGDTARYLGTIPGDEVVMWPQKTKAFWKKHSKVDLDLLGKCTNIDEFFAFLKTTPYWEPFSHMDLTTGGYNLADYESVLETYYYYTVWKDISKFLTKKDKEAIKKTLGTQIDALNIQCIYRAKKYFQMPTVMIYSMLIPIYHRLSSAEIKAMVEAPNVDEFIHVLQKTKYANLLDFSGKTSAPIEHAMVSMTEHVYLRIWRNYPDTIACVYSYLYFKEHEIRRITTIIEGIRYRLTPQEIADYALQV